MTDKELRKLKRSDLMELFYYMRKEIDTLQEQVKQLQEEKQQLSSALEATKLALEKIEILQNHLSPFPKPEQEHQTIAEENETENHGTTEN